MIHGPCGSQNPSSPCMVNGRCSKSYPKQFCAETIEVEDSYPQLRRRSPSEGGFTGTLKRGIRDFVVDNRNVVPYNAYLLQRFECHINVELCQSLKAIKYLNKYVYKGSTKSLAAVVSNSDLASRKDEIRRYVEVRHLGPAEAINRLFSHTLADSYPPICRQSFHLQDHQSVTFTSEAQVRERLLQQQQQQQRSTISGDGGRGGSMEMNSMLLAFFSAVAAENLNPPTDEQLTYKGQLLPRASSLTYIQFPKYFTHSIEERIHYWRRRKLRGIKSKLNPIQKYCSDDTLGRIYFVFPNQEELFFLRKLLTIVRGPTSHADLRHYEGITYGTFKECCIIRGLVADDKEWHRCMEEAAIIKSDARSIRNLFVVILIFNFPQDPLKLWNTFKDPMSADFAFMRGGRHAVANEIDYYRALDHIKHLLSRKSDGEKTLQSFHLPEPDYEAIQRARETRELGTDDNAYLVETIDIDQYDSKTEDDEWRENQKKMNPAQQVLFSKLLRPFCRLVQIQNTTNTDSAAAVIEQVSSASSSYSSNNSLATAPNNVFIDAPGGTGKTFVLNTFISFLIAYRIPFVATAFSGVAARLLKCGRTTHSTFKMPVHESGGDKIEIKMSPISLAGRRLRDCQVVIIDEAPMMKAEQLNAIHRLLLRLKMPEIERNFCNNRRQRGPVLNRMDDDDEFDPMSECPFGGAFVILSGDFRQTLPVCPNQGRSQILTQLISKSCLWSTFQVNSPC